MPGPPVGPSLIVGDFTVGEETQGEKLEIVQLTAANTVESLLSLDDGASYFLKTGSFKVIAPVKNRVEAADQRRWGGSRQVGEVSENGMVTWEAGVAGTSEQGVLEAVETLLAQLEANPYRMFVLWQPPGASHPTLYEMRGTGQWEPAYEWAQFAGTNLMIFTVQIPVAPLAQGLPVNVYEQSGIALPETLTLGAIPGDAPAKAEVSIETGESLEELFITGQATSIGKVVGNATYLYWTNTATGYIGRAKLNGTSVESKWLHTEGQPLSLAVDSEHIYWTSLSSTDIGRATLAGATIEKGWLALTNAPYDLAVEGDLFWTNAQAVGRRLLPAGAVNESFLSFANESVGLAVTSTHIYVGLTSGKIARAPFVGGAISESFITGSGSAGVAVSGGYLYVSNLAAQVIGRWSLNGGEPFPSWAALTVVGTGFLSVVAGYLYKASSNEAVTRLQVAAPAAWALISWASQPTTGLAAAPFGVLESSTGQQEGGWTEEAVEGARGGTALHNSSSKGAAAYWNVDPARMTPDSFSGELAVEVWARVLATDTGTTTYILSAQPQDGLGFGSARYTDEWGSAGRTIVNQEGATPVWRLTRLGTLHMLVNPLAPRIWRLYVEVQTAGVALPIGLDYLVLACSLQRACSPSSKPNNVSFPRFISTIAPIVKTVRSNLSAVVSKPGKNGHPDNGLGGQLMTLPPGESELLIKLSSLVPDSPEVSSSAEQTAHTATVTVTVTPRWQLVRTA